MGPATLQNDPRTIEEENRRKFRGDYYKPDTIMKIPASRRAGFFVLLRQVKLDLVRQYNQGGPVLDLCCATGEHLVDPATHSSFTCGLDLGFCFLSYGARTLTPPPPLVCADAQALPFRDACYQLIYSFSSLYFINDMDSVLREIHRALRPGGFAILDLGNRRSLNTYVSRAHGETAQPCYLSTAEMRRKILAANLQVVSHRAFQIFPLWGNKPGWLRPLLSPRADRLMSLRIGGRMLDEWICRLPGFRQLAFRHIFVCRREDA